MSSGERRSAFEGGQSAQRDVTGSVSGVEDRVQRVRRDAARIDAAERERSAGQSAQKKARISEA